MPEIKFVLKYPEKFLSKTLTLSYLADLASKKEYPVNEKIGGLENELFRKFFYILGTLFFWLFNVTN